MYYHINIRKYRVIKKGLCDEIKEEEEKIIFKGRYINIYISKAE